ncbi:hypothetical protein IWW55_005377, partial [Coemansia sp. RSA 2706]
YLGCYYRISLKLSDLIDPGFIANYVKRNTLVALSADRFIDADDVFAIDGRGTLILSVCKDTYETLGLVGRQAKFPLQRDTRYVIEIDLLADCMDPMKKYFQRIKSRFDAVLDEPVEFLVGFYDKQSGTPITFDLPGASAVELQSERHHLQGISVPRIDNELVGVSKRSDVWVEQAQELFEWIGLAASCSQAIASNACDSQISTYSVPQPNSLADIEVHTFSGLISAQAISSVAKELANSPCQNEIYICVWGYEDAPVSWKLYEHGFLTSGENMYAQAYVPDQRCCLTFQACGPWDDSS